MTRTKNSILPHFLAAILTQPIRSELAVTWMRPSATDTFGPGDLMIVQWGASNDVTSPAFRLCSSKGYPETLIKDDNSTGRNGACGTAVQSMIEKSAGSYFTSL